jgi:hypothetical protein
LACESKKSPTFAGKVLDKLEQFYAYLSTAGEDMRFFGFAETAPVVRKRLDTVHGLPEGARVIHPVKGAGLLERIGEHEPGKLFISVKYDSGQVHEYNLAAAAELRGVSKRSAVAAQKTAQDEMIAVSFAAKLKKKAKPATVLPLPSDARAIVHPFPSDVSGSDPLSALGREEAAGPDSEMARRYSPSEDE